MKIRFTKRTIVRLREELKAAQHLNNLRLYKIIKSILRNTKKDSTHCKYFPTFDELGNAVIKTFETYMQDATKVICVMKKLREDAGLSPA